MKKAIYSLLIVKFMLIASCGEKKNTETAVVETEKSDAGITITKEQFNNSGMVLGKLDEKSFPVMIQTNGMIDVPPGK